MRRDLVVAILGVLALFAVSVLAYRPERPSAATRSSTDYSFGGYRAWYDLLAREGLRVERFRRHHDALGTERETLILAFPEAGVAPYWNGAERDALRAWVRHGGRLIDVGETPRVESRLPDDDAPRRTKAAPPPEKVYLRTTHGSHGPLRGPWAALVGTLDDRGTERLVPTARSGVRTLLADGAGVLAVRYAEGRGEVIAIARARWFENRSLARAGAARLAYLAAAPPTGQVVIFDEAIRGDIVEKPWYEALTAAELVALAIFALAGLLWLLYGIVPLGPAVRLRAAREPTSEEFIDAVAALYERAHARDHARDALLRDARRSLDRAPPAPEIATLRERVAFEALSSLRKDEELIGVAQLARTARDNPTMMVTDREAQRGRRRISSRGRLGGAA